MREVLVLCEGQTEREFCRSVVAPKIVHSGIALKGTLVGKPHRKRGGIRDWPVYRKELLRLAKERSDRHVGVLVDYYGMPRNWPGRASSNEVPIVQRGLQVEEALQDDLNSELGDRFHPCVQLHEFESLLFVDPNIAVRSIALGGGITYYQRIAEQMEQVKCEFEGHIEAINDSPESAPSKRLKKIMPGYDKVAWGVTAAKDITLEVLRNECSWLNRWLTKLETQGEDW